MDKLKIFIVGVKIYYEYGWWFKEQDTTQKLCKLIVATTHEEAIHKFEERYDWQNDDIYYLYEHPSKIINKEIIWCEAEKQSFDDLKEELYYKDFLAYMKQELNVDQQIEQILK